MLTTPLLLTEEDVRAVLPMRDLIEAMETALVAFSAGSVLQPVRSVLEVGAERNYFGVMPAALPGPSAFGTKLVTVFHRNHARHLPSHLATIVLHDAETGALSAVVDGRYITEARTAAVSALSVRALARPGAARLAILGSGVQARSHFAAISEVVPLADVRIWSPTPAHREACARDLAGGTVAGGAAASSGAAALGAAPEHARTARHAPGPTVRAVATPADAIRGADIIVLATAARTPIIEDADVSAGTHICAVGACRPDQREMPTALVRRARVFVDSRAGALTEAGELLIPMREGAIDASHIAGELGALLAGSVPGRRDASEITIFKSLGMAVEDVAAAGLALARARSAGRGTPLPRFQH